MTFRRWMALIVALMVALTFAGGPAANAQDKKKLGGAKNRDQLVSAGVAYLKSRQTAEGMWSKGGNPGITGLVLTGLFRSGKVTADDPVAAKGLKFVESLIDPKEGHLAGGKAKVFHRNYVTCVNLIALKSSGQEKYATVIAKATAYLKALQWGEAQEKTPKDAFYGGVGYGPKTRPDLSNTQFFLDALKAAGVPAKDAAYKKSVIFVSRCQNLKGEHNDQPWADKINDGSFIYVLGVKGKKSAPKEDRRPGYGSMTYAGLKSLVYGGVSKEDVRYKKAWEWVTKHYSVDENAGMPEGAGGRGYYYGLMTLARCLDALGVDVVVDAKGKKHDWRADVTTALATRQRKDGGWANETDRWMESNPDLCTAYALIALSHCKPK